MHFDRDKTTQMIKFLNLPADFSAKVFKERMALPLDKQGSQARADRAWLETLVSTLTGPNPSANVRPQKEGAWLKHNSLSRAVCAALEYLGLEDYRWPVVEL